MKRINNLRVASFQGIAAPAEVFEKLPVNDAAGACVAGARENIENILSGKDKRKIIIVGPCSIHNYEQAIEYAKKLNELRKKVEDKLVIIMRTYLEKPRTTVGWKGFLYDPHLDGSYDLIEGVMTSRKLLLEINEMGLPTATEVLGPVVIQYYSDLICWSAIGARTAESQTHRELASGLSMPVGFKNGTAGNLDIAINAILAAQEKHHFLGMDDAGRVAVVETKGNQYCHLILRGGSKGPNYDEVSVKNAIEACKKADVNSRLIVDCSHANSEKNYKNQGNVFRNVWGQIKSGNDNIAGLMIESNLFEGSQKISQSMQHGVSVTDSCISFEETERLIMEAYL
ncbi:3-deoxy-7-phosphoheptulonate synthase [Candidatus Peregrinibacteria bacterium CG10_big_fil_rev_8_21_14_0_10_36_19]|nr:MAG: 3-deoxy-7-phosphoheptulonate synthase [Candidatus Peregrinibacteria bacterium CG10_big_fil_rev_8_21_14_0_10_36_19]